MGVVASTLTDRLMGVGTPAEARYWLRLMVTRLAAGRGRVRVGTVTARPASSEAWKVRVAVPGVAPGFCKVRYSTNPGLTVPSAKKKVDPAGITLNRDVPCTAPEVALIVVDPGE